LIYQEIGYSLRRRTFSIATLAVSTGGDWQVVLLTRRLTTITVINRIAVISTSTTITGIDTSAAKDLV
jgi:hypothetical protein